ncbi:hypothetical protein ABZ723_18510 [Streptomyces sp. NPDC006700]|uniref:hypothetical protein n=1 Tax=Streptomyces sp. NPDC006700 TaxID=3154479 RepID=UPI0033C34818
MTPGLRAPLRATVLLITLAAAVPAGGSARATAAAPEVTVGFPFSSVHGTSPSAAPPSPSSPHSASASASPPSPSPPSSDPSRAGSRPGEGRLRPGRPHDRPPEPEDDDTDGPGEHDHRDEDFGSDSATPEAPSVSPSGQEAAPLPSGTESPGDLPVAQDETDTGPVLRYLPLGSGLVLIGLGLGLAFIALRMRRS